MPAHSRRSVLPGPHVAQSQSFRPGTRRKGRLILRGCFQLHRHSQECLRRERLGASEEAGIALPADTKISFAETPLIFSERKAPPKAKTKKKPAKEAEQAPPLVAEPTAADEAVDPEAEKPKLGELNEGIETVPR